MAEYKWTTHYVNDTNDIDELEDWVKKMYPSRFRIDEVRFKTLALRKEFQNRLIKKFLKVYEGSDLQHQIDVDRLFNTIQDTWITEYGVIKISDLETMERMEKENVRTRRSKE